MQEILRTIWSGLTTASPLDQINLVLGLAGVCLMIARSLWAFPVGLIAVTVQGMLFFQAKFYADSALQVFFFVTLAWGWWHWARGTTAAELPVTVLGWRARLATVAIGATATVVWALALEQWTDAIMPWRDAFIAAFSVLAQVLQARKNLENWPLWLIVNGVALATYWHAELAFTAFLYLLYFALAVLGWRAWSKTFKIQNAHV